MLSPTGKTIAVAASLLAAALVVAALGWPAARRDEPPPSSPDSTIDTGAPPGEHGPRSEPGGPAAVRTAGSPPGAGVVEASCTTDGVRPAAREVAAGARAEAPQTPEGTAPGVVVLPAPPCRAERLALGPESVVIEAEAFQFMTYGWEIGETPGASGGRYIHMKEGVGDYESEDRILENPTVRSGDFYNATRDRRPIEARCYFTAPRAGRYVVACRTMAHGDHCSNITYLKIGEARHEVGRNGTRPLVWLWHDVAEVDLRKGLNRLSFMAHQDGVKVDQVVLTPLPAAKRPGGRNGPSSRRSRGARRATWIRPERAFSGGCPERPALPAGVPPVNLSLSVRTLAVTGGRDPGISAYVHKNAPGGVEARVLFALEIPGLPNRAMTAEAPEDTCDVRLTDGEELVAMAWRAALPRGLARREYLVRCKLSVGGEPVEERTLVLFRGYDWSVLGPLPYMEAGEAAWIERDARPAAEYALAGRAHGWKAYDERCTDHFGIMDFGKMLADRAAERLSRATVYAYTEVDAREAGPYLMKAQGDDDLVVWVNGRKAVTIAEKGPPIRTAREVRIRLKAGRNRLLFRLNQKEGLWQAAVRIRTLDDQPADVEGMPYSEQDVGFARKPASGPGEAGAAGRGSSNGP